MPNISFFDFEIDQAGKIKAIGAIDQDNQCYRGISIHELMAFLEPAKFFAGHNIFNHDLIYLHKCLGKEKPELQFCIDTLLLSPLLFPARPYHKLGKEEKLDKEHLNDPVADSVKSRELFYDEVSAFVQLPPTLQHILFRLLSGDMRFKAFFSFLGFESNITNQSLAESIFSFYREKICSGAPIEELIASKPVELAYALSLANINDKYSITPPWVLKTFPVVNMVMRQLRGKPCLTGCYYCNLSMDPAKGLKKHFGFNEFRLYDGKPMQQQAVKSALDRKSLLAVFPTGGGKSITFQLPALMDGENTRSLTVIISPLQSLMKDQVDNLEKKGITTAVTINGLLHPIERSKSIERVLDGTASLLYISPELLRSRTIENLLLKRKISRFVIDEAHCFSSWGQDFRVDYLYIGDFLRTLQDKKGSDEQIPVSCFTATAKPKVIEDIRNYFRIKLSLELELFRSDASRTNLHYKVFHLEDDDQKYRELRRLLETKKCPTIIYVSRTKSAAKISEQLTKDGFEARMFHGQLDKNLKAMNQNDFIEGKVDVMVATSAFGMGVDKADVGMVIHYNISDSLENYVQEAGRGGRDESITADCHVLFHEDDLNKHFTLLNQTKLDIKEINQVWRAIKELTRTRSKCSNSALEIARKAGWDEGIRDIETRVKTAIAALEDAGYVKRLQNMPQVFADSITVSTAREAIDRINASKKITTSEQKESAIRIIKKLISSKSKAAATDENPESRVDYISDQLGIHRQEVISIITLLREENILADHRDLTAFIKRGDSERNSIAQFEKYKALEDFFSSLFSEEVKRFHIKEINEQAKQAGCTDSSPQMIRTLLNFWSIRNWIKKQRSEMDSNYYKITLAGSRDVFLQKLQVRQQVTKMAIEWLFERSKRHSSSSSEVLIEFSICELQKNIKTKAGMFQLDTSMEDIEDALFFLSRTGCIKIEGGFLIVYNKLTIDRLEMNTRNQYKQEDYQKLKEFYDNKVQQIHIVGEYARKMAENYSSALQFVDDYFKLNYSSFLRKYFNETQREKMLDPMTPAKFKQLFGALSTSQLEIVTDKQSTRIVVGAGPGSGKTRLLVHKLAALLHSEDVKYEQLLMLTFSRAAATEFKKRLIDLIGTAANFVEIKTFHSYCFDLLGRIGNLEETENVLPAVIRAMREGNIERSQFTKAVLVIDEAQDMDQQEYDLVMELMEQNEDIRVIMVGDDDQNIYQFRGSDSKFMQRMMVQPKAKFYELVENYRSDSNLIAFSNNWLERLKNRLKKTPIMPFKPTMGILKLTEYESKQSCVPVVNAIFHTELKGTTCVLTRTNEEAEQIAGMLNHKGIKARLIQSNEGFRLTNLREMKWFSDQVLHNHDIPVITEEEWEDTKRRFKLKFSTDKNLVACLELLHAFESVNIKLKYKTDWKTFLAESRFEDFVSAGTETILVSTIHKAKGKEFDNVFLVLSGINEINQVNAREIYVALTRAKSALFIHYNGDALQFKRISEMKYERDTNSYPEPEYVSFFCNFKDVQLSVSRYYKGAISQLESGDTLLINQEGLTNNKSIPVVRFSKKFRDKISRLKDKYEFHEAKVNFIVNWWNEEVKEEIEIVLPEVTFRRKKEG